MPHLKQHKKRWRDLLTKNNWSAFFRDIQQYLNPESSMASALIQIEARYNHTYQEEHLTGVITADKANALYAQIRESLLHLIAKIDEKDSGNGLNDSIVVNPLDDIISKLQLKQPITPLFLVNCNRRTNNRKFRRAFRSWESRNTKFQFYFSLGCPSQEPEGFAERIVLEILASKADTLSETINYERIAGSSRVHIPTLPVGFDLSDSQKLFTKTMCQRFGQEEHNNDIYQILNDRVFKRKDKYIAFPYGILASDWDSDFMVDYLQWIIELFTKREKSQGPNCIFIFVIWLKNAHEPSKIRFEQDVFEDIQEFSSTYKDKVSLLYPLKEVPRHYFELWLEKIAEVKQQQIEEIMTLFTATFSEVELDKYQTDDQLLDMERIEELQERIWSIHQDKTL
jgi:hypothetical protein